MSILNDSHPSNFREEIIFLVASKNILTLREFVK